MLKPEIPQRYLWILFMLLIKQLYLSLSRMKSQIWIEIIWSELTPPRWKNSGVINLPLRSWLISFRYHTPLRVQCHFLVLTHEKFSIGSGSVTSRSALVRGNSFCWKNTEAPLILVQPLHIWTYCSSIRCPGRWADIHWVSYPVHLVIEHLPWNRSPCVRSYRFIYISPIFQSC